MQAQAPLAFQRLALRRLRKARPANDETGGLHWTQEDIVRAIGDFANGQFVDHRSLDPHRCGIRTAVER
jgi:hypothetical protein